MSSEDNDDYMSDEILKNIDSRPGLVWNRNVKRQQDIEKHAKAAIVKNKVKPLKVIEAEKREQGLNQAISSTNKGFQLMEKMGYKPGKSLGKTNTGRIEPIPVNIKADRKGLGTETVAREMKETRKRHFEDHFKMVIASRELLQKNYRSNMSSKAAVKEDKIDLYKSQRVCENLDKQHEIVQPLQSWYWSNPPAENDEDEIDDAEEINVSEQLEILTRYLRSTYHYCLWCGTEFEDEKDLKENCPGNSRMDH